MPVRAGYPAKLRGPRPMRSVLSQQGITTIYRLGGILVAPIPARFTRQMGWIAGDLIAWADVGENRLLLRKASVIVHGSREVR